MYNYDFYNEKVVYENNNTFVNVNKKELYVSLLITTKNILLFQDLKKSSPLNGRELYIMPEYDLLLKIDLGNTSYKVSDGDTLIDNNIVIYNFDLDKIIK